MNRIPDGVTVVRLHPFWWQATDPWSYPSFPGGPMVAGYGWSPRAAFRDLLRRRARLERMGAPR